MMYGRPCGGLNLWAVPSQPLTFTSPTAEPALLRQQVRALARSIAYS